MSCCWRNIAWNKRNWGRHLTTLLYCWLLISLCLPEWLQLLPPWEVCSSSSTTTATSAGQWASPDVFINLQVLIVWRSFQTLVIGRNIDGYNVLPYSYKPMGETEARPGWSSNKSRALIKQMCALGIVCWVLCVVHRMMERCFWCSAQPNSFIQQGNAEMSFTSCSHITWRTFQNCVLPHFCRICSWVRFSLNTAAAAAAHE